MTIQHPHPNTAAPRGQERSLADGNESGGARTNLHNGRRRRGAGPMTPAPFIAPPDLALPDVAMDEVIANSYRDFHTKGFDYICLRRSPTETVKLYFFNGDVSKLPEVINPHDHRYDFKTTCVAGAVENVWYQIGCHGPEGYTNFEQFEYRTPLNGGDGFRWVGRRSLAVARRRVSKPGDVYFMNFDEIHTIRMVKSETVLCLIQYEDRVTDGPTFTFTRNREPPSLDGLYRRFDADTILARLGALKERVPSLHLPRIV